MTTLWHVESDQWRDWRSRLFLQEKFLPIQWLESKFKKRRSLATYWLATLSLILNGWLVAWDNLNSSYDCGWLL